MEIEVYYYHCPGDCFCIALEFPDMKEYHMSYKITGKNLEKLIKTLNQKYQGPLEEMCKKAFGSRFGITNFEDFLKKNGIEYTLESGIVI